METQDITQLTNQFDDLSHTIPEEGVEFWFARDLMEPLGYVRWENFKTAIDRAVESCKTTGYEEGDHFRGVTKMVQIGSGADRSIEDIMLTRYACYLIAQNGDPRKPAIAFAQSYFAIQTCKQELIEDHYGITQTRPLADFLPTLTIAAKNLATEMTNHNVTQEQLHGETLITREHEQNNRSVRDMLGQRGIQPEQLPAEEDIKKLERRVKTEEKKLLKQTGKLPVPKQ